jgi:MFS family permease
LPLQLVALVDELWSGVAFSGAPSIEREFALSHRAYVAFVFVGPILVAALVESAVALLSDVWGRRRLVVAGQAALSAALFFSASSKNAWGLSVGLALAGAASGVACGAAQAFLVASNPQKADRTMVRWTLFAAIGDVFTPLVAASGIALGHSYRGVMAAIAIVVAMQCAGTAVVASEPLSESGRAPTAVAEPVRLALARAVRRIELWVWLFAAATCTLLDELVVALVALRLERDRGLGEALAAAAPVTFCAGSVLGVALTDGLVARHGRRRVLVLSGVFCALAIAGVLVPGSVLVSCLAFFFVGVMSAPHHALALAQAYDLLPNRPGTVQAIGQTFVLVDIVAPLALGFVADRFGLGPAIACLVVQPAVIVVCAGVFQRATPAGRSIEPSA